MNLLLTILLMCVREIHRNQLGKLHRGHRTGWGSHKLEGRGAIQRDLGRLERWDNVKLPEFNKAKCQVLNLGWSNPRHTPDWVERWLGAGVVSVNPNMSWQCALAAQKARWVLSCILRCLASRLRRRILQLPSSAASSSGAPNRRRTWNCWASPEEATKMVRGLIYLLRERQAEKLGLLSLEKGRLQGNTTAKFQYLKGVTGKLERDPSQGTVLTGQGGVYSNTVKGN